MTKLPTTLYLVQSLPSAVTLVLKSWSRSPTLSTDHRKRRPIVRVAVGGVALDAGQRHARRLRDRARERRLIESLHPLRRPVRVDFPIRHHKLARAALAEGARQPEVLVRVGGF